MDKQIQRIYIPMSESAFYILFALQQERHGYDISRYTEQITDNEVRISAGTMYGSLSKFEKDGLIRLLREEERRKIYDLTPLGQELLDIEKKRIGRLYRNISEEEK